MQIFYKPINLWTDPTPDLYISWYSYVCLETHSHCREKLLQLSMEWNGRSYKYVFNFAMKLIEVTTPVAIDIRSRDLVRYSTLIKKQGHRFTEQVLEFVGGIFWSV